MQRDRRATSIIYPRLRTDLQGPGMICGVNASGPGREKDGKRGGTRWKCVTSVFLPTYSSLRVLLARPAIRVLFSVLGEASPFLPRNFVIFFRIVSRQDNL